MMIRLAVKTVLLSLVVDRETFVNGEGWLTGAYISFPPSQWVPQQFSPQRRSVSGGS